MTSKNSIRIARTTAAAVGVLALGALTTPAHAEDAPWVFAGMSNSTLTLGAAGSPGKVFLAEAASHGAVNVRAVFDISKLAGIATAQFPKSCTTAGAVTTCPVGSGNFDTPIPVILTAAAGTKSGATGTIDVAAVADNASRFYTSATVKLADGIDLVVTSGYS